MSSDHALACSDIVVTYDSVPSMIGEAERPAARVTAKEGRIGRLCKAPVRRLISTVGGSHSDKVSRSESASTTTEPADSKDASKGDHRARLADSSVKKKKKEKTKPAPKKKKEEKSESLFPTKEPQSSNSGKNITCAFLEMLPLELRQMVYRELLVCDLIRQPDKQVEERTDALIIPSKQNRVAALDIDATFLPTCRRIYREALPILYGENRFMFFTPRAIESFREKGLAKTPDSLLHGKVTKFDLREERQGRLKLIRKLSLVLSGDNDDHGYGSMRDRIMSIWTNFLQDSVAKNNFARTAVEFPALEDLHLDFSSWQLRAGEGIAARTFVERFKKAEGLRRLEITGVIHETSLKQLREGLLGKGGRFVDSSKPVVGALTVLLKHNTKNSWESRLNKEQILATTVFGQVVVLMFAALHALRKEVISLPLAAISAWTTSTWLADYLAIKIKDWPFLKDLTNVCALGFPKKVAPQCMRNEQLQSLFFTKLPRELRDSVYCHLLTQAHDIEVGRLTPEEISCIFLWDPRPSTDLDPTILRSCQRVYCEASPILYGKNQFRFQDVSDFQVFAQKNIDNDCFWRPTPSMSAATPPCEGLGKGRLSKIRRAKLSFPIAYRSSWDNDEENGERCDVLRQWRTFLSSETLDFPALKHLYLDFSSMNLEAAGAIAVHPFAQKFAETGGLDRLEIKGLSSQSQLEAFRTRLLKKGGTFMIIREEEPLGEVYPGDSEW